MEKFDRNSQIMADLDSGMTRRQVAEKYGISMQRVSDLRIKMTGYERGRANTKHIEQQYKELKARLDTLEEIVRLYFIKRIKPW